MRPRLCHRPLNPRPPVPCRRPPLLALRWKLAGSCREGGQPALARGHRAPGGAFLPHMCEPAALCRDSRKVAPLPHLQMAVWRRGPCTARHASGVLNDSTGLSAGSGATCCSPLPLNKLQGQWEGEHAECAAAAACPVLLPQTWVQGPGQCSVYSTSRKAVALTESSGIRQHAKSGGSGRSVAPRTCICPYQRVLVLSL